MDLNFTDVQIPTKGVSTRAFQVRSTGMVPEGWQSGVVRIQGEAEMPHRPTKCLAAERQWS